MKRTTFVLLALLMLSFAVSAFGTTWESFSSEEYGYSLKYPAGWEVATEDETAFSVTTAGAGMMPTVIMVMVQDVEDEDFEEDFEASMQEAMQDIQSAMDLEGLGTFEVKDQGIVDLNGHQAYWVYMNLSIMGMFNMRMDMYMVRHRDRLVVLTFNSDAESFQANSEIFDGVIENFELK